MFLYKIYRPLCRKDGSSRCSRDATPKTSSRVPLSARLNAILNVDNRNRRKLDMTRPYWPTAIDASGT